MRKLCEKMVTKKLLRNKSTTERTFTLISGKERITEKPNFLQISSHMMKHGFSSLTQKQSIIDALESPLISKNNERVRMSKSKLKAMLSAFLILRMLS